MRIGVGLIVATLIAAAGCLAPLAQAAPNETTLQGRETGSPGVKQNGSFVDVPVISDDGRYIAFTSNASNLGGGFTGFHIYLRDTQTNTTTLVSRADGAVGDPANSSADNPSISADGRFVAFESQANNLGVANPLSNVWVYVRDTVNNTTTLVSRADGATGDPPDGDANSASISADGGSVAFRSAATNLDDDADAGTEQVFVRDITLNETILASRADGSAGAPGDDISRAPSLSGDGTFVAFESFATNLDPGDSSGTSSVFVRDVDSDTTDLVSRADGGGGANANGAAFDPSISADGDRITFVSPATNLDASDAETSTDIFVRDRSASDSLLASASGLGAPADGPDGHPAISADGRTVVFESGSSNLYPGFTGNFDIAIRDIPAGETHLVSRADGASGTIGNHSSRRPEVSADGTRVAFYSEATNLDADDADLVSDVYMRETDIDVTPPTATIDSGPSGRIADTTPTIAFSSPDADALSFECFVDDVSQPCSGPGNTHTTSELDHGSHILAVRATDMRGNVGEVTERVFSVDSTGPTVTLDPSPSRTSDATPSLTFTSTAADLGEFRCRVDSAPSATCTSPFTAQLLGEGTHTFSVRALDDLGNAGAEVSRTFTVDTAGPATNITSKPPAETTDTTPTVAFSSPAADAESFACSVDGGGFSPCTSPLTTTPLALGAHTVAVRATDDLGNEGAASSASFTVVKEAEPPPDTEVEGPNATLARSIKITGKEIVVPVTAGAAEAVTNRVSGVITLTPKKGNPRTTVVSAPNTGSAAGKTVALKLKYSGSKKHRQKATKRLVQGIQAGGKASIEVRFLFDDAAGNVAQLDRAAKLKAEKKK